MRTLLILATIMTQLFLTSVSWAEPYQDCKVSCASDKSSRDIDCPSQYDSSDASQERDQCLKNSRDAYNSCIDSCPPPPPPPESNSSSMRY